MNIDETYMSRALQLAKNGFGRVSPNPMVGAVVVADGRIIGEGFHRQWGHAHAEVNAIASVTEDDRRLLRQSRLTTFSRSAFNLARLNLALTDTSIRSVSRFLRLAGYCERRRVKPGDSLVR